MAVERIYTMTEGSPDEFDTGFELHTELVGSHATRKFAKNTLFNKIDKFIDNMFPKRNEISFILSDLAISPNETSVQLLFTGYDPSIKQIVQRAKYIPLASKTANGAMPKESYAALTKAVEDIAAIKATGGAWIKINFNSKQELINYNIPADTPVGNWTDVLIDESRGKTHTRYSVIKNGVGALEFAYQYEVQEVALGIADVNTLGLIKSVDDLPANRGKVFVEINGTLSLIGWDNLVKSVEENTAAIGKRNFLTSSDWMTEHIGYKDTLDHRFTKYLNIAGLDSKLSTGSLRFLGGVIAPNNGMIYLCPYNSRKIMKINPYTYDYTLLGVPEMSTEPTLAWAGGCLGEDGIIYFMPFNSKYVLSINPVNDSISLFGDLASFGNYKWLGGITAKRGKIYGIPYSAEKILEIDTILQTVDVFGDIPGMNKYYGGSLGINDKIYCVPFEHTSIGVIDPTARTYAELGSLNSNIKYAGGVLAPNGKIYCPPHNENNVLVINTINDTYETIGNIQNPDAMWNGAVIGNDGNVYGIPYKSNKVLKINTNTNTIEQLDYAVSGGDFKYGSGLLTPNGEIMCIPLDGKIFTFIKVKGFEPYHHSIITSRFYNKL